MKTTKPPRKIKFENVGKKKQHAVNLFELAELEVDITKPPESSYALNMLYEAYCFSAKLLEEGGIEVGHRLYRVVDKKVVPWQEGETSYLDAKPLIFAIEERDQESGQRADYLAALVVHHVPLIFNAIKEDNPPFGYILDTSALVQGHFFQLMLLLGIQDTFSAGKSRTDKAHQARGKWELYGEEARQIFNELINTQGKSKSYRDTAIRLRKNHQDKDDTPAWPTIKDWHIDGRI